MMSLHRLGPLAEEYYLSRVAGGIEDYYSEGREAPGRWLSRSRCRFSGASEIAISPPRWPRLTTAQ